MEDHLPDEDALVLPDTWRRALHARRGGLPGPDVRLDAKAPRKAGAVTGKPGGAVRTMLAGKSGDPELAAAAGRHLGGEPDPVGAAAVAVAAGLEGAAGGVPQAVLVDALIVEHGLPFAACALVELASMQATRTGPGPWVGTWTGVERRGADDVSGAAPETLRRVRALLASTDDATYAEAVERLAAHRNGWANAWLVSYLVPTREDWVDECCAAPFVRGQGRGMRWLVLSALGRPAQLTVPYPSLGFFWKQATGALLATMADGIGPDVLAFFLKNLDRGMLDAEDRKRLAKAIGLLPSDDAFRALLDRRESKQVGRYARAELGEAMKRFPARALRLLAEAGADDLLAEHVRLRPEAVAAALPGLSGEVRAAVGRVTASSDRVPDAPAGAVPRVLAAPPWETPVRPVVAGLAPPAGRLVWRDGEREEWLAADIRSMEAPVAGGDTPEQVVRRGGVESARFMVHGPEDVVRPLLAGWKGFDRHDTERCMRVLIARYGLDALPPALRIAKKAPRTAGLLQPFLDAGVAVHTAGRLGTEQDPSARRWLDRHGVAAVPYLVPALLGEAVTARRAAERALRVLDGGDPGGRRAIVDAARAVHGDEAAGSVAEVLAADPVETGLVVPAPVGDWADPAVLPQVLVRGGGAALPDGAVARLVRLLALPSAYGLDEVREACDSASLAEFGWALFVRWLDAGGASKESWALAQLGWSGDDATVRRLTPVIRAWPGEGRHPYAVVGLDVLTEIGSDVALLHLNGIAQKVRFKGIQAEARRRIREVADRLGLSAEQLADRLVPAFGLDASGSLTLDYGPRRFTVGFDEALRPVVADEGGKPRKSLPKPGAKDDAGLAPAAHRAFAELKKDVRAVAADLLRRLEAAMVERRRWTAAEFGEHIAGHPLVRHVARRLVWIARDGDDASPFRVAEDGTFADVHDDAFDLPARAAVGVAHPLHLGDGLEAWAEVFADYEILQPFPQLARPVHALTTAERESERLERFEGLKVPFGTVLGLVRRGWERGAPQDAGVEGWISRQVGPRRHVVIDLDPGFSVGELDAMGDHQTLRYVWLGEEPTDHWYRSTKDAPLRFGELDPVTASEILADLTVLAEAAV
ncbi:DUF4132 domain-containing protein [Actinomadura nitritigenes]|uniref:DUF4132 domain-containing protein n=1 Tax=Actinomadura nitritigenes TaxID=134602 RepID=UPI003D8D0962